jgi:hypothetical protein
MIGKFHNLIGTCCHLNRCVWLVFGCWAGHSTLALAQQSEPRMEAPRPHYSGQVDIAKPQTNKQPVPRFSNTPKPGSKIPSGKLTSAVKSRPADNLRTDTEFNRFLTQLALNHLPAEFEEDKDWGKTAERWDGIKFRRDEGRLETQRRRKTVNHGTWKKYSAELIDPTRQFSIEVKDIRELEDNQVGFAVHCGADVNLEARQSKWIKGIQLYSLSAQGHARLRLEIEMQVTITTDPGNFPPDLVFAPKATSATIHLDEFRIDRVSKLGGEFAQQVSRVIRKELEDKIEQKQRKLVDKINRELDENRDRLRIPVGELLNTQWSKLSDLMLDDDVARRTGAGNQ